MMKESRTVWRLSWVQTHKRSIYHCHEEHYNRLAALIRRWSLRHARHVLDVTMKAVTI